MFFSQRLKLLCLVLANAVLVTWAEEPSQPSQGTEFSPVPAKSLAMDNAGPGGRLPLMVQVISNIGKHPVLLFTMESNQIVKVKFSLFCTSVDQAFTVTAITSNDHVAIIPKGNHFNVSCEPARRYLEDDAPDSVLIGGTVENYGEGDRSEESGHLNVTAKLSPSVDEPVVYGPVVYNSTTSTATVTGQAVLGIRANLIGRSFLIFLAKPLGMPDMSMFGSNHSQEVPDTAHGGPHRAPQHPHQHNPLVTSDFQSSGSQPGSDQSDNPRGQPSSGQPDTQPPGAPPGQPQGPPSGQPGSGLPPNAVGKAMVIVMQLPRLIDQIFRIMIYIVITFATIGMGVKVELEVVKEVMKKPVAPVIGLFCQYVCMPLIAYTIAHLVPQESASISLGIFTCGIVPGGGASNMYTYLLGGDISLSITMTSISCVFGLAMIPIWMFTLGETFKDDTIDLHIPYPKILETLAVVLIPLCVGIFVQHKFPKIAKIIMKILKPTLLICVCFLLSVGIYANMYIFKMIRPMVIFAGCLLPYCGYLVGGLVSLIFRLPWTRVKTVSIETGVQNVSIAFLIVFISFPPPDNQLAAVAPAASAIMTPLPLLLLTFIYTFYKRRQNKKKEAEENAEECCEDGQMAGEKEKSKGQKAEKKEKKRKGNLWERLTLSSNKESPVDRMLNHEMEVEEQKEEQTSLMTGNGTTGH